MAATHHSYGEGTQNRASRRLDFLTHSHEALDLSPDDAGHRAPMTYSLFPGTLAVRRDPPDQWPAAHAQELEDYPQFLMLQLMPPGGAATGLRANAQDIRPESLIMSAANR